MLHELCAGYCVQAPIVPVKLRCWTERQGIASHRTVPQQELSADKAVAEAELDRTLGTLRYLKSLQAARARAVAVHGPAPETALLAGQGAF